MAIDRNEYLCDNLEIVGLIPAAGKAERIQPLPCSKELIPTGFYASVEKRRPRVRVAMSHLLESLRCAGVKKAFVVLRKGKWDIPNYFGCGKACGPQLAYIITEVLVGVPYTIDQAYPFIKDCQVLLVFRTSFSNQVTPSKVS
jgi:glucose-1-phosphate thymidylyltransferase